MLLWFGGRAVQLRVVVADSSAQELLFSKRSKQFWRPERILSQG